MSVAITVPMSFELVSERKLSEEELAVLREATRLLRSGYSRRECLKLVGLSGAVVVKSFFTVRPARAFVPLLPVIIEVVDVAGPVILSTVIAAIITVSNSAAEAARGPIAVAPGLVEAQDSKFVNVPPETQRTYEHKGFRRRWSAQTSTSLLAARIARRMISMWSEGSSCWR
jgi:hypothetical protein